MTKHADILKLYNMKYPQEKSGPQKAALFLKNIEKMDIERCK